MFQTLASTDMIVCLLDRNRHVNTTSGVLSSAGRGILHKNIWSPRYVNKYRGFYHAIDNEFAEGSPWLRTNPALCRALVGLIERQCMKKAFHRRGNGRPTPPTYRTGLVRVT